MNLKKFSQKDRFGNMLSYEFESNVPEMSEIPPAFQPGPKGTDQHPAWLTAGENIINAEASRIPGVQPMLDQLNEMGRAIQDRQGGPIPTYAQEGTKVTDNLLDAIMQVESGGDTNAVSPVGASGPYQIMEATALNPGYGVKPISSQDRFNPEISRSFAKEYLEGIAKANPNFNTDQLLQAYHSGVGNVKKGNIGPVGAEYPNKVNEAMNKEMPLVTYDMTPEKPGMISAMASNSNEVARAGGDEPFLNFFGDKYKDAQKRRKDNVEKYGPNVVLDSMGNVQSVNPNRIKEDTPQILADRLANNQITKEQYDNQINAYNIAIKNSLM